MDIQGLFAKREVVVCIGTGGVGKTTVAASIGVSAARAGRRVAMLTIDPSKRLAQALGLDLQLAEPQRVDGAALGIVGPGTLSAQMLDVQHTFDKLIRARAHSADEADKILSNRIYQNFSQSLVGSHEYAAVEVLTDLYHDDAYDLVVVDTPPSQNAIDFFGAPARILAFLGGQGMLGNLPGASLAKRVGQRLVDLGGSLVQKTVGRVAGASTLEEVLAFLRSLATMYGSFEQRARGIDALLRSERCGFCLVGGPAPMQVAALEHYVHELAEHQLVPWGTVLNRIHMAPFSPTSAARDADNFAQALAEMGASQPVAKELMAAAHAEQKMAERDLQALGRLRQVLGKRPVLMLEELSESLTPAAQLQRLTQALEGKSARASTPDKAAQKPQGNQSSVTHP